MKETSIELDAVTKRFGAFTAVDDVSFAVGRGEIFAFLGPNGAGKTTTIRMIMGLLTPTAGAIRLGGHDLAREPIEAKRLCGFVPDRPYLYEKLTSREMLRLSADLYGVDPAHAKPRGDELLQRFDLWDWRDDLVENFSHGMKQRLAFCAALLHEPSILVIDEPMVGLDPRGARMLRALLRTLADGGATVFLSTHSLEVAEALSDRIGILRSGKLVALGTLGELRAASGRTGALEEIFLALTGAEDMIDVIEALQA
jgi:ABC-2 type transport system ATP-binding protein